MPDGLPPDFGAIVRSIPGVSNVTVIGTGTFHVVSSATADGVLVDRPPDGYLESLGVAASPAPGAGSDVAEYDDIVAIGHSSPRRR